MKNFEKINSSKFNKLNETEMINISGGKKWETEFITGRWSEFACPGEARCYDWVTQKHQQQYNIFGNPTGVWKIIPD